MEKLEKRMYFLVPYNISPIQQGIQAGHAVVEYGLEFGNTEEYKDWAENWKTFIILNGGTSNDGNNSCYGLVPALGTMEQHMETLIENGVNCSIFKEPDLNYCLTGISFIVDERVFNKRVYPDYTEWIQEKCENEDKVFVERLIMDYVYYDEWVSFVGGDVNVFLRDFLKIFRLA